MSPSPPPFPPNRPALREIISTEKIVDWPLRPLQRIAARCCQSSSEITPRYHLKFPPSGFCFLSGGTDRGTLWRSYAPPFSNLSMLLLAVTGIVGALDEKLEVA